jgi:hypothetical protein
MKMASFITGGAGGSSGPTGFGMAQGKATNE